MVHPLRSLSRLPSHAMRSQRQTASPFASSTIRRISGIRFSRTKNEPRGGATLTFGVRDLDAARRALEGAGVPFDGATMTFEGIARLATFFDPDGNKLMLYQDLKGRHGGG